MTPYAQVGVVTAHPLYMIWKHAKSIISTWLYARKLGLPCNKWYGVYETGTEIVLAQVGCLPGSEERARRCADIINTVHRGAPEYGNVKDSEIERLVNQIARLQHSTGACEQIRKDQEIQRLYGAMEGWRGYGWKDGVYVDDLETYFNTFLPTTTIANS